MVLFCIGVVSWMVDIHLPRRFCRCFSADMGYWMTIGMAFLPRVCVLYECPVFPVDLRFQSLNPLPARMEIDDLAAAQPASVADVMLADLFGGEVSEVEGHGLNLSKQDIGHDFFCPVVGCSRSRNRGPAWGSKEALRAHLDLHLQGELQGRPEDRFLDEMGLRCCHVCGRTISVRHISGVHPACWPKIRDRGDF